MISCNSVLLETKGNAAGSLYLPQVRRNVRCEAKFLDRAVQKYGIEDLQASKSSLQILPFRIYARGLTLVQLLKPSADLLFRDAIETSYAIRI